jgi:Family of unknown function (DUF5895)
MATRRNIEQDDFVPDDYYAAGVTDSVTESVEAEVVAELPPTVEHDPFMGDEFNDPNPAYPRIQTLRGEGAQKACWFIPATQLDRSGWLDPAPKLETYHFQGGDSEEGLIIYEPRMLVATKSLPQVFDRVESAKQKRLVLVDRTENIESPEEKANYGTIQYFRIYLLDQDNCPLAEMPFEYRSKGATRATFLQQWGASCDEITLLHCRSAGKPFAKKNDVYRSLCVFRPLLAKQKVETETANVMAAKVVGYHKPTESDWMSYFLGRQQNADWFSAVMDAGDLPAVLTSKALGPAKQVLTLPAVIN